MSLGHERGMVPLQCMCKIPVYLYLGIFRGDQSMSNVTTVTHCSLKFLQKTKSETFSQFLFFIKHGQCVSSIHQHVISTHLHKSENCSIHHVSVVTLTKDILLEH